MHHPTNLKYLLPAEGLEFPNALVSLQRQESHRHYPFGRAYKFSRCLARADQNPYRGSS